MNIPRPTLKLACMCIIMPTLFFVCDAGSQELPQEAERTTKIQNNGAWKPEVVADFIKQMVSNHGFDQAGLETTFGQVRYSSEALRLVMPAPPGKPKNWQAYRERFIEPIRIKAGVAFWDNFEEDLARAEKIYGVPAEIIVGIIGVESFFGRTTGKFRTLDALSTLAFDYPDLPRRDARMAFFRAELEQALLFARENGLDPLTLKGSYAGAIGWAQFMPSSIRQYAVDFDGDNKIDLRKSPQDAIGSVANYLARHGWRGGDPIVFSANIESVSKERLEYLINQGLEAKFSPSDLKDEGVKTSFTLPRNLKYGLVDLQNGEDPTEYWLGTNNFFAITKYNRSYFYAMSVAELGKAVRTARNPVSGKGE